MPSEPMFTKPLEVQAGGAIGFNHVEVQGAVSVLPFAGITGGKYWGKKNTNHTEYGINLFGPLTKNKTLFVSLSGGKGFGNFNRAYHITYLNSSESYLIKNDFNSVYIQPCIYYVFETEELDILKFGLSLKHQEIFFNTFNIQYNSRSGLGYYTYEIHENKNNANTTIKSLFFNFNCKFKDVPVYFLFQGGYTFITNKFSTEFVNAWGGDGKSINPLRTLQHPMFNPWMLNISLGLKIN